MWSRKRRRVWQSWATSESPGSTRSATASRSTLSDVLGMAKGTEKRAEIGAVAIIRTENGKQRRFTYDLTKFLKSGDTTQNPNILPGDVIYVAQTRSPDWESVFRSLGSVAFMFNPFL